MAHEPHDTPESIAREIVAAFKHGFAERPDYWTDDRKVESIVHLINRGLERERRSCEDTALAYTREGLDDPQTARVIAQAIKARGYSDYGAKGYWQVFHLPQDKGEGMKTLRSIFDGDDVDYQAHWLFLSTSGVHGSYTTLEDIAQDAQRLRLECDQCGSLPDEMTEGKEVGDQCPMGFIPLSSCDGKLQWGAGCWDPNHPPTCNCGAAWDEDNHPHVYPDRTFRITVLVVKPRVVQVLYGTIWATVDDIPWLQQVVFNTLLGVAGSQNGNMPPQESIQTPECFDDTDECKHLSVMPTFDEKAAEGLTVNEIRERWPRFMGECPECGGHVILYASFVHYIAGDW